MKIYHTCECCNRIHKTSEVEGPAVVVELRELCQECAEEIGVLPGQNQGGQHFYN